MNKKLMKEYILEDYSKGNKFVRKVVNEILSYGSGITCARYAESVIDGLCVSSFLNNSNSDDLFRKYSLDILEVLQEKIDATYNEPLMLTSFNSKDMCKLAYDFIANKFLYTI